MVRYPIVLFDADNTLFDFHTSEREALCDALRFVGITPNEEMIQVYSRINDALWKRLERGEVTKNALRVIRFEELCAYYGLKTDVARLAVAYTDFLSTKQYLMPGAMEVCEALAPHCDLYIITNGIKSVQRGRFEPSPLRPFFKDLFISEELGFEKPKREYFDAVAASIPDFDPRRALVVGDSLSSDVQGGIQAGIDTCWINHKGQTPPDDLRIDYVIRELKDVVPLVLGA